MLPQGNRLRKTRDFERVFSSKSGIYGHFIRLSYKKNDLKTSRLAVVVGLKINKSAVIRNKIKRRIRMIFQKYIKTFNPPLDIVVNALKGADIANFKSIKEDIEIMLRKIEK